jgi:hypothetical protein
LTTLLSTRRKKKKMKRQRSRRGRPGGFVMRSREVNVIVELGADFPMMSK